MTWLGLVSSGRSPHLYVFSSDRGPWCKGLVPPCHVPEENSTFLRKTLPYLSMLLYCFSTAVSASASRRKTLPYLSIMACYCTASVQQCRPLPAGGRRSVHHLHHSVNVINLKTTTARRGFC